LRKLIGAMALGLVALLGGSALVDFVTELRDHSVQQQQ